MKSIWLLILFLPNILQSQTITPSASDEYCPYTTTNFIIIISGNYTDATVSGGGYITVGTQSATYSNITGSTTVTMSLLFADVNVTQTLTLTYNAGFSTKTFNFTKIKSLNAVDNNYSYPATNISSYYAPLCESKTFTVSFPKVPYVNVSTTPHSTFDLITNYEYSLPAGWSINGGSPVSGTSDYQIAGESVTITTDNYNGNGEYVKVRSVNNCSGSYAKGPWTLIAITRGKPQLAWSTVNTICTSNVFQANSVPAYINSYSWSVSATTAFSFSNANSNPTTITTNYPAESSIDLAISGPSCPYTWTYNTSEIIGRSVLAGGTPPVSTSLALYFSPGDENGICYGVENYIPFSVGTLNTPTWTEVSHTGSPAPSWNGSNTDIYVYFFNTHQTSLVLQMDVSNSCGSVSEQFGFAPVSCAALANQSSYLINPNPSKGNVTVSIKKNLSNPNSKIDSSLLIRAIQVYDLNHQLVFTKQFSNVAIAELNIGKLPDGNYFITVSNAKGIDTQQIIKR